MTPSEELRAAARTLREAAAKATPGPWQACQPWTTGGEWGAEVQTVTTRGYPNDDVAGWGIWTEDDGLQGGVRPGDARWIALANPTLAEPLAKILYRQSDVLNWAETWDDVAQSALIYRDLARLITTEENTQ